MDYNKIFSDLKKYEEQLLVFIEIYFNELNKDNKDDLIFTQNIFLFLLFLIFYKVQIK
jgi:hypothetical protein